MPRGCGDSDMPEAWLDQGGVRERTLNWGGKAEGMLRNSLEREEA